MLLCDKNYYTKVSSETKIEGALPSGVYTFDANMALGVFMRRDKDPETYRLPKKTFGDIAGRRNRIIQTWRECDKNMGVLLSGVKGTGKSLLLKDTVNQLIKEDVPVINFTAVIGQSPDAQINLIEKQKKPVVLVIDEVEKVFALPQWQERLLTFLDGTFDGRMLTLMTANEVKKIDENFFNRPGRIRYNWVYKGLEHDVISEVVKTTLKDKKQVNDTIRVLSAMEEVTFDIVASVVEEMNIYGITIFDALDPMNINKIPRAGFAVD